jgi:hypothetical protein
MKSSHQSISGISLDEKSTQFFYSLDIFIIIPETKLSTFLNFSILYSTVYLVLVLYNYISAIIFNLIWQLLYTFCFYCSLIIIRSTIFFTAWSQKSSNSGNQIFSDTKIIMSGDTYWRCPSRYRSADDTLPFQIRPPRFWYFTVHLSD